MPTYEFLCRDCKAPFEVIMSMAEYERSKREDVVRCSSCGGTDIAPQITTFEVQTSRKSA